MKLFSLMMAITAGVTMAACPNKCSGHGSCGSADLCTCQPRWTGADCSKRECPYGRSWTVQGKGVVPGGRGMGGMHPYTECSSKGICDTGSGECQCFEGYEGRGCRRQSCPNDCSGNGRCIHNSAANSLYTATYGAKFSSQTWDKGAMVCVCDRGYEGYDCSSRICPKGDDPVTDCASGGAADANSLAHNMVQRLYVLVGDTPGNDDAGAACAATSIGAVDENGAAVTALKYDGMDGNCDPDNAVATGRVAVGRDGTGNIADGAQNYYGYISLKYTDMFGGEYFTRPILIDTTKYATLSAAQMDPEVQWTGTQATMYGSDTTAPDANDNAKSNFVGGTASTAHAAIGADIMKKDYLKRYTADRIRDALQSLPNFAIPQVNVTNYSTAATDAGTWGNVFDITFGDSATAGKQNLLECVYDTGRACDGAQPKMANQNPHGSTTVAAGAEARVNLSLAKTNGHLLSIAGESTYVHFCKVYEVPLASGKDYEENAECSNRGLCDSSTGTCNCFEGHTGENCSQQTVFF